MNYVKFSLAIPVVLIASLLYGGEIEKENRGSQPPGERIVHFPKDRSLGELFVFDRNALLRAPESGKPEKLGQARGDVVVPAGKELALMFADPQQADEAPVDLSPLDQLGATDLQALSIPFVEITADQVARLARHKTLRYLSLGPLSKANDDALAPLSKMTWLEGLSVPETDVSDAGLNHLEGLTNLQKLDLYATKVTDQGLVPLARMRQLKTLQLGLTKVTDAGLKHLAGLTDLEQLQLGTTSIRGPGLAHLEHLSKLKHLNLMGTKIGNADLVQLEPLKCLERIDLSGTQVDDDGLGHLTNLSHLKTLLLARTQVTDAGVDRLKQALPECKVHR